MTPRDLSALYEKMHLQELELKERINLRVQVLFTFLLAAATVACYMLRMLDYDSHWILKVSVILLLLIFSVLVTLSGLHSIKAYWGNTFAAMPSAGDINKYVTELNEYASQVARGSGENINVALEVEDFLSSSYCAAATHNAKVNAERNRKVFKSTSCLIWSTAPLILAGGLFAVFDLDASSPRKNLYVMDRHVGEQLSGLQKELKKLNEISSLIKESAMPDKDQAKSNNQHTQSGPQTASHGNSAPAPSSSDKAKPSAPMLRMVLEDINSLGGRKN